MLDITSTKLLSAEQIREMLGISPSTFNRLRRMGGPPGIPEPLEALTPNNFGEQHAESVAISVLGISAFPPPSLHVIGAPRWTAEVVNRWVDENKEVRSGRGGALRRQGI